MTMTSATQRGVQLATIALRPSWPRCGSTGPNRSSPRRAASSRRVVARHPLPSPASVVLRGVRLTYEVQSASPAHATFSAPRAGDLHAPSAGNSCRVSPGADFGFSYLAPIQPT